jgi:hypothetical protein
MKKQFLCILFFYCLRLIAYDITEISLEQIFNTAHIASDEELQLINRRCKELNLNLFFIRDENSNQPHAYIEFRGNIISIPQELLASIYTSLTTQDNNAYRIAKVRTFTPETSLCIEEIEATNARVQECNKTFETLLHQKIDHDRTPRIAVCCSGGGIRACVATAGFLKGLDQEGLWNTITYLAGLSGSTWAIAPYEISDNDNFKDFHPILLDRIVHGFMNKPPKEMIKDIAEALPTIAELLIRKLIFRDTPNIIDVYGFCLAETLLSEKDSCLNTTLVHQQKNVVKGQRPYPLYTAIVPHNDGIRYDWITFSPYEIMSDDFASGVPTWAFGRSFENGISTNKAPALPLGFCMGIWGSAISVSFEEFYNLILDSLEPKAVFAALKFLAQETTIGDIRIFPAIIRNYTYKMKDLPRSEKERNTVVDAGISINLPLPPLLNIDRNVDIIIMMDASADVLGAQQLRFAERYAADHNLPFPRIDYNGINDRPFSIFDDGFYSPAPIIIYVPMVKNANYSTTFDPQDHLQPGGFLNTGNFDYSIEQAKLLSGLLEQSAHELKPALLEVMKKVIKRKS